MPRPTRRVTVIAFNFGDLLRLNDEALPARFRLVPKVNPTLLPRDFRPEACRISRHLEAITLRLYGPPRLQGAGPEVVEFCFQSAG